MKHYEYINVSVRKKSIPKNDKHKQKHKKIGGIKVKQCVTFLFVFFVMFWINGEIWSGYDILYASY